MWSLVDVNGNELKLTENNIYVSESSGVGVPELENVMARYGIIDGGSWQRRAIPPRQFTLVCRAHGRTWSNFQYLRQQIVNYVSLNYNSPLRVRYRLENNAVETLCYYSSGLGLKKTDGFTEALSLTFICPNPFWREVDINNVTLETSNNITMNFIMQQDNNMAGGVDGKVWKVLKDGANYLAFGEMTGYAQSYDGAAWSQLGSNTPYANLKDALADSGNIYAVGDSGKIEVYDGAAWSILGTTTFNNTVHCIRKDSGGNIYVGGEFTQVNGDATLAYLVKWDGNQWAAVSTNINNTVYAMDINGLDVYVGGAFTLPYYYILKVNGTNGDIEAIAGGNDVSGIVYAIKYFNSIVYIGGAFVTPGYKFASYDSEWIASVACSDDVVSMADDTVDIYAASTNGQFNNIFDWGNYYNYDTYLDESTWDVATEYTSDKFANITTPDANIGNNSLSPYTIYYYAGDGLYAGVSNGVQLYSGGSWSSVLATNNIVRAVNKFNANIYYGGDFTDALGDYLLRYDGVNSYGLGTLNGAVYTLLSDSPNLYVGGAFTTVNGVSNLSHYAIYDGDWNGLDFGALKAIATDGLGNLYIGGTNGVTKVNIASGVIEYIGLELINDLLYSGGKLYMAGGFSGNYSPLPSDYDYENDYLTIEEIWALPESAYSDNDALHYVAAHDGTSFEGLGQGTNGEVYAIDTDGTFLYAVGNFTDAGLVSGVGGVARCILASYIWASMGSGINVATEKVNVVQVLSGVVYVAGNFTQIDTLSLLFPSAYFGGAWYETHPELVMTGGEIISILAEPTMKTYGLSNIETVSLQGSVISYEGTAPCAPTFIFSGAGTIDYVKNGTTNKAVYFNNFTIGAGDVATLTLQPESFSFKNVYYGVTTTNIIAKITQASNTSDFRLMPGDNTIQISFSGVVSITMQYYDQHWSIDGIATNAEACL